MIRRHGMPRATKTTLTCRDTLQTQLTKAREAGYAVDDEEHTPGLRCVAAPVYDDKADVICAVSISGLRMRITPERVPALGRLIAKTASEITAALGGRPLVH